MQIMLFHLRRAINQTENIKLWEKSTETEHFPLLKISLRSEMIQFSSAILTFFFLFSVKNIKILIDLKIWIRLQKDIRYTCVDLHDYIYSSTHPFICDYT